MTETSTLRTVALLKNILEGFKENLYGGDFEKAKTALQGLVDAGEELRKALARAPAELPIQDAKDALNRCLNEARVLQEETRSSLKGLTPEDFKQGQADYVALFAETLDPHIKKISEELTKLQNLISPLERPAITVRYEDAYKRAKRKHSPENQTLIEAVEGKIIDFCERGAIGHKKITDPIKHGVWKGYLHAWLPKPISDYRIVFTYEGKRHVVTFYTIGRHIELGLGEG